MEVREDGVLIPKVTTSERLANASNLTSSDNGLLVYDTGTQGFWRWNGTQWVELDNDNTNELQNLSEVLTRGNNAGGNQIQNIGDPSLAQDAATKAYVDLLLDKINTLETLAIPNQLFNGLTWTTTNLDVETINSRCYLNNIVNCVAFGALYTQQDAQNTCASLGNGWRLPTKAEWDALVNSFGGYNTTTSYNALIFGGTSGFNAKRGGFFIFASNQYLDVNTGGYYWTSTPKEAVVFAGGQVLELPNANVAVDDAFSVRCVK